ncbi:hypothetical protein VP01_1797g4 [Puccinia sorghi]|uniref:Peptidase S53 domain-containing protein n=1 Tax=Puccinia sorghi TaxID=27349 RepID=A0A0L6VEH7_9BASI|nr:hypothetical protein VP01_1797g4 [Puccinia sorghi]
MTITSSASFLVLYSCLFSFIIATPVSDAPKAPSTGFRLLETHHAPPSFTKREIPHSHKHTINLKIGLKSDGIHLIKKILRRTSDPLSPSYGKHLTRKEVNQLIAPSSSSLEAINNWLASHGLNQSTIHWSHSKDWVTLNALPLQKAEEMLDTTYFYYQHEDGEVLLRTESYSLPHELHSHVELVQFGRLSPKRSMPTNDTYDVPKPNPSPKVTKSQPEKIAQNVTAAAPRKSACQNPSSVTNACLRELYQTDSYRLQSKGNANKIGITAYLGERANYQDLKDFLKREGLPTTNNFTVVSVNGGTNPQEFTPDEISRRVGAEGNLDIQTTMGFTAPMPNVFYTTAGTPPFKPDLFTTTNSNEPYLEWLTFIAAQPDSALPQVITTSSRGVSLIFSSGDDGVGQQGTCASNDGKVREEFGPPFVTAVGATQRFYPEEAVSVDGPGGFSSGGGFSEYFVRPDYQSRQVRSYLNILGSNYTGLYNPKGRAVPDVSAQGSKYLMTWRGMHVHVGGSSAAAPTFASVIALLNDDRISRGLTALGFLNPWLYSQGYQGLNDVVIGSSSGCGTTGFAATKGWDPVTGLGTPNFPAMQRLMPAATNPTPAPATGFSQVGCQGNLMQSIDCFLDWRALGH